MRKLLLLFWVSFIFSGVSAQIIEECNDPNTIVLSSFCGDACVVCDINGYSGNNSSMVLGEAPPGFCAGQLHNTQWVGFVAGSTSLSLSIAVYNCTLDQNGDGQNEGLQIGIYNTTDCSSYSLVSNCDDQVPDNTSQVFTNTTPLIIGGIYFLVIDGAFGDICDFTVTVISGSTTAPPVAQVVPNIVAPATVCQGGVLNVSVNPPISGAGAYYWTLDGDEAGTDRNSAISFPSELGTYTLCVDPYNPCYSGLQNCVTVEVVEPIPQLLSEVICEGESYSLGGQSFTEPGDYDVLIPVPNNCDLVFELSLEVIPTVETYLDIEICNNTFYQVGSSQFSQDGDYEIVLSAPGSGCDSIVYLSLTLIGTFGTTQLNETICAGQSYAIGGNLLTQSGSYFYQLQDEVGCDSLVDLQLTVLPRPTSTTNATICTGQSYSFNGTNYSSPGTYSATFPRPSGCDSVATLNLSVVSSVMTNLNPSICAGESYVVGPNTYSTAGNYTINLTAANGCDSIVRLNLAVLQPVVQTATASVCQGDSYTINGNTFSAAGTYNLPYTAASGCDSIYRLTLTVLPNVTRTISPSICVGETYGFGGQSFSAAGTYTVVLPASNGCDSITTINLAVDDVINTSQNIQLCAGESITIDNTTLTATGTYNFAYQSVAGCDSLVAINLQVAGPIVTNLNITICQGTTYPVGAQTFNSAGNYSVTLPAANGCDSTVNLQLAVTQPPVSTTTASICQGQTYPFNGQSYTTSGMYTANLTTPAGCDSIAQLNLMVTSIITNTIAPIICIGSSYSIGGDNLTTAGTYTYTFPSSAGCDSVVTVNLQVENAIITPLTVTICEGEQYTVGSSSYSSTGDYQDSFVTPDGCDSLVQLALTVIPTFTQSITTRICAGETYTVGTTPYSSTGSFTNTLTAASGCDSVVTLNLTVVNIPNTSVSAAICDGGSYTISENTYTTAGQYTIPLTSVDGCDSIIVLDLIVTDFYETNLNITRCEGASYTVGLNTYTTTGNYQDIFQSQDGCDSIVNLALVINPLLSETLNVTLCDGESYTVAGVPYTTAGTYQQTVPSVVTGCDSTITLNLVVNPVAQTTLTETICAGESVNVGSSVYTQTGNYSDNLQTTAGCDSIVALNLTVIPLAETTLTEVICAGESVVVGSDTFTASGQYTVLLTAPSSGCDSVIYLDLTVNALPVTDLTATVCAGESYTIGGVAYAATGTYQEVVPSLLTGCDSTINLNLVVNPVYDEVLTAIICDGENVAIGNIVYTQSGVWPTLLVSSQGCDSLVTLDLTVNSIRETNLTETICAGESYSVGTTNYTTTGSYTQTLVAASTGCDSIVNLALTALAPIETFLTEAICAGESYTVGAQTYATTGNYSVTLTAAGSGCDSTIYLDLLVNEVFTTTLTETICNDESFAIGGQSYTNTGTYQANLSTVAGCDSTVILNLTVAPCALTVSSSIVDNDCQGDTAGEINFSISVGTAPYSFTWNSLVGGLSGNGNIAANNQLASLTGLPAGNYRILVTDANGVMDILTATVSEPPALALQLEADTYGAFELSCADVADGSLTARVTGGTPPYTYTWSNGTAAAITSDLAAGTYSLTVSDASGCTTVASSILAAPPALAAALTIATPVCDDLNGGSVSVEAVNGGTGPYLFALDGGAFRTLSLFTGVPVGTHTVTVQDANGCVWEQAAEVAPAPELTVELGADLELAYGDSIQLLATTSYPVASYKWTGEAIISCDTCATPLIKPEQSGQYTVTVIDENGCTATDRITVLVRKVRDVYIPTAFSPDGDEINDNFLIYGGSQVVSIRSFSVFNRWGEAVYEGQDFTPNNPDMGWDGTHRGQPLNAGVYIYMAEITFTDGETILYKGDVMLMR
jgi:gliding motility-associated-like protein